MTNDELITALSENYPLTAQQISDVLNLLGIVAQFSLQSGAPVELPGIGTVKVEEDGNITIVPSPQLKDFVANKDKIVKIQGVKGITNTDLWIGGSWAYKHNVNVC